MNQAAERRKKMLVVVFLTLLAELVPLFGPTHS
jgi:hypothetical protein